MAEFDNLFGDSQDLGFGGSDPLNEQQPVAPDPIAAGDYDSSDIQLPDLNSLGINQEFLDGLNLDSDFESLFGASQNPAPPEGFSSFSPSEGAGFSAPEIDYATVPLDQVDYSQPLSYEQLSIIASRKPRAEGLSGVKEEAWESLSPSGKNGLLRALGITGGAAVGSAAIAPVAYALLASNPGGWAVGIGAAVVGLIGVSTGAWGGKKVADLGSDYDEKAKAYTTAKARLTSRDYEGEPAGQFQKDQATVNTWENTMAVEQMQDKSFVANAAGFGAEMLPYIAEFAGGMGAKSKTLGSLILNPKKAGVLMSSARALVASRAANNVDDAVALITRKIVQNTPSRIHPSMIGAVADNAAKMSGGRLTKEAAEAFLQSYQPGKLAGNPLIKALAAGTSHGLVSSQTVGREMVGLDQAAYEGTPSEGYGNAVIRHVTEIASEYLGEGIFDKVTLKPLQALAGKVGSGKKAPEILNRLYRATKQVSQRLNVQAGLPEYWEETTKELVDSMLNLNDDGRTTQSARVAESLASFVPHTGEQFELLANLQVLPAATSVAFAAIGGKTEQDLEDANRNFDAVRSIYTLNRDTGQTVLTPEQMEQHAVGLRNLLIDADQKSRRLIFTNKFGDSLPAKLKYIAGSMGRVWDEKVRHRMDFGSLEDLTAKLKTMSEEKQVEYLRNNILEPINRQAFVDAGYGDFLVVANEAEQKEWQELVDTKNVSPAVGGGFQQTLQEGVELSPKQKELLRKHAQIMGIDQAALDTELKKTSREIDLGLPTTAQSSDSPGLVDIIEQHTTRDGRVKTPADNKKMLRNIIDSIKAFNSNRAEGAALPISGVKVHLVARAILPKLEGYRTTSTGNNLAPAGVNFVDSDGVAHIYIAPNATSLDISEEMVELNMQENGVSVSTARSKLKHFMKSVNDTVKALEKDTSDGEAAKSRARAIEALKLIQKYYYRSGKDYGGASPVNQREVFELLSSLVITAAHSKMKANLRSSAYFGKPGSINDLLGALMNEAESNVEVYKGFREALGQLVKTSVNPKQFGRKSVLGAALSTVAGYDTTDTAGFAVAAKAVSAEVKKEKKKPAAKVEPAEEAKPEPKKPEPKKPKVKEPAVALSPRDEVARKLYNTDYDALNEAGRAKVDAELGAAEELKPAEEKKNEVDELLDDLDSNDFNFSAHEVEKYKPQRVKTWRGLRAKSPEQWARGRGSLVAMRLLSKFEGGVDGAEWILTNLEAVSANIGKYIVEKGEAPETDEALLKQARNGLLATLRISDSTLDDLGKRLALRDAYLNAKDALREMETESGESALTDQEATTSEGEVDESEQPLDFTLLDGDYRSLVQINEAFKAMGLTGGFNRMRVWQLLRNNKTAEAAATSQEAYDEYRFGFHEDAHENAFASLLVSADIPRQVFHDLVVIMHDAVVPGVYAMNFKAETVDGKTSANPTRFSVMSPRFAYDLVRTVRQKFAAATGDLPRIESFVNDYIAAAKAVTKPTTKLREAGISTITDEYLPVYRFMSGLLGMSAYELRAIDQVYLSSLGKEYYDPPVMRMFKYDVFMSMYRDHLKLGPGYTGALLLSGSRWNRKVFSNGAWDKRVDPKVLVKSLHSRFYSEAKVGRNTQTKEGVGSSVENIVRSMRGLQNPSSFQKPSGGRQNNILNGSRMFFVAYQVVNKETGGTRWKNLQRVGAVTRTVRDILNPNYSNASAKADVSQISTRDMATQLRAQFEAAKVGEEYPAWIGPMGDKKDIWTIDRTKLSLKEARARLDALYQEITGGDAAKLKKLWKFFSPSSEYKTEYQANHALTILETTIDLHSKSFLSDFKNSVDLVKRRGSDVSNGVTMLESEYEALVKEREKDSKNKHSDPSKINVVTINDPTLVPELIRILNKLDPGAYPELSQVEISDGFALGWHEFMDTVATAYGPTVTNVGNSKGNLPKLNIIKSIIVNDRLTLKQSIGRLSPEFAASDSGLINHVFDMVQRHLDNGGEAVDIIAFSSGVKRAEAKSKAETLFETTKDGVFQPNARGADPKFTFSNITQVGVNDFRWQLNAQKDNVAHMSKVPRQLLPVMAEFPRVMEQFIRATVSGMDKYTQKLASDTTGGAALVKSVVDPKWAAVLDTALETGEFDALNRMFGQEQVAKHIMRRLQFQAGLGHEVEWPIGTNTEDLRDYTTRVKRDGEWVDEDDPNAEGARMAFAHADTNQLDSHGSSLRYNETVDSYEAAEARIRKEWKTHLDMFEFPESVKSDEDAATAPLRDWEIVNHKGKWIVPGEPFLILRVPADNTYSASIVRAANRIQVGPEGESGSYPNVIRTPLSIQVAAGSDFDVDKRFVMPFKKGKDGAVSYNDEWNKLMNSMVSTFTDSANYRRLSEPLNNEIFDPSINRLKESASKKLKELEDKPKLSRFDTMLKDALTAIANEESLKLGSVRDALQLYSSNQVGRRGLGIAASLIYGLNVLNEGGIKLFPGTVKEPGFRDVTFTDPLSGERKTLVAGRTDYTSTGYGESAKKVFGAFLNLFADHGKEQKITKLGITEKNIATAMALMFAHGSFDSLESAVEYLETKVAPFLLTPEAMEWMRVQDEANRIGITNTEQKKLRSKAGRIKMWRMNLINGLNRAPTKNVASVFDMVNHLQAVNRLLRLQFRDLSSAHEYLRSVESFKMLQDSGRYGMWQVTDGERLPAAFEPTETMLEALKEHAFSVSARTSPIFKSVYSTLFDRRGEKEPGLLFPSQDNVNRLEAEVSQAVAVRALGSLLADAEFAKKVGFTGGSPAQFVEGVLSKKFIPLLNEEGAEDNPFLQLMQTVKTPNAVLKKFAAFKELIPAIVGSRTEVGIVNISRGTTFPEAEIKMRQAGFDALPEDVKFALLAHAVMVYGLDSRSFKGSYLQFISPSYRLSIHTPLKEAEEFLYSEYGWSEAKEKAVSDYLVARMVDWEARPWESKEKAEASQSLLYDPSVSIVAAPAVKEEAPVVVVRDLFDALPKELQNLALDADIYPQGTVTQPTKQEALDWALSEVASFVSSTSDRKKLEAGLRAAAENLNFSAHEVDAQVEAANAKMKYNHLRRLRARRYQPTVSDEDLRWYNRMSKTPKSLKAVLSRAAYNSVSNKAAIGDAQRALDPLREKLEKLETKYKGQNEALKNATVEAAMGYYPNYSTLEGLISSYFDYLRDKPRIDSELARIKGERQAIEDFKAREAEEAQALEDRNVFDTFKREEDYLKGLLDGTIEPYLEDPGEQQEYRKALEEHVAPAAAELRKILDDKPAPNLQNSARGLSYSAHEVEGLDKIVARLDSRTTHGTAQALLKLATRSSSWVTFRAGIASQKLRRLAGASKYGYFETGSKKEGLGEQVLQAITVLREGRSIVVNGEVVDGLGSNFTIDEAIRFAEEQNLRLPGEEYMEEIPADERGEDGQAWRYKDNAVKVADILVQYKKSRPTSSEDLLEMVKINDKFYQEALEFANETVGGNWIGTFRLGYGSYALHQYDKEGKNPVERELISSEESARILARGEANLSYVEAALNGGRFAKTLDASKLLEQWDTTVNTIMRHKVLFRGLSKLTDVFGNSLLIPAVPRNEEEGNVPGTLLESEDAERILNGLVESARLFYKYNDTGVPFKWERNASKGVFSNLNDLVTYLAERDDRGRNLMEVLGYSKVTADKVFGLRNQSFWVIKGPALQAVRHLIEPGIVARSQEDDRLRYRAATALIKFNRLVKTLNVGFSLFHHFALIESWLADTGASPKSVVRVMQNLINSKSDYQAMFEDSETASKWVLKGLQIQATPMDVDLNTVNKVFPFIARRFENIGLGWMGTQVRRAGNVKVAFDNFLWHKMLPVMKLQMAEEALKAAKRSGSFPGVAAEAPTTAAEKLAEDALMDDIAKYVNDALGTQEWSQYLWATPYARDVMNMLVYAPDWSISALNISGVPEIGAGLAKAKWLGYSSNTDFAQWRRTTRYIPGFYMWIFLAVPSALQSAITAAFGGDDEDDKYFTFENEYGRKYAADITPLIRHAAIQKGLEPPTRRIYVQPGKQVREVFHWLTDPVATAFSKSSAAVRIPITATTGVISPSLKSEEIWSARDDADKMTKIAGNLLPFAATALSRQEIWGGPLGTLLTVSMPRVSGQGGMATTMEVRDALESFSTDRDVEGLAPAVAKQVLDERIRDLKDRFMRQGASEKDWREALQSGASMARGKINKQLREEWMKDPGKADGEKISRLLIASNMLYKSNSEARERLKQGIKDSIRLTEKRRSAPHKVVNLEAKLKGNNQQDIRKAARSVGGSGVNQYRASPERLRNLEDME